MTSGEKAGRLAFDIMRAGFHLPLVDGKPNYDKIDDEVTIAMYSGHLGPVSQKVFDLAIWTIEELIKEAKLSND